MRINAESISSYRTMLSEIGPGEMLLAHCQLSAPLEPSCHFPLSLENQFANSINPRPASSRNRGFLNRVNDGKEPNTSHDGGNRSMEEMKQRWKCGKQARWPFTCTWISLPRCNMLCRRGARSLVSHSTLLLGLRGSFALTLEGDIFGAKIIQNSIVQWKGSPVRWKVFIVQ